MTVTLYEDEAPAMFIDAVRAGAIVRDIRDGRSVAGYTIALAHAVSKALPQPVDGEQVIAHFAALAAEFVDWMYGKRARPEWLPS